MSNRKHIYRLAFAALGVGLNIVSGFLVLASRLPLYGDTLGTIFVGIFCGPLYAVPCAMLSSLINGTFDPCAIPFMPNGIAVALFSGLLRNEKIARVPLVLRTFVVSLPASIVSASIAAFAFDGITSAGSSYIVQILHGFFHLPMVMSVFAIQVVTDYADKLLILIIITVILRRMPQSIKEKV